MTTSGDSEGSDAVSGLPGFAVTGVTPDERAAVASAMLIAMLAHDGENVTSPRRRLRNSSRSILSRFTLKTTYAKGSKRRILF